jgi:hypothetical protein
MIGEEAVRGVAQARRTRRSDATAAASKRHWPLQGGSVRPRVRDGRRGYALILALVGLAIIIAYAIVLARYAVLEMAREKQALLESCAQQIAESARAWSLAHARELSTSAAVTLPIEELLPPGASGRADLRLAASADGRSLVECYVALERGHQRLTRRLYWPPPAEAAPATAPAATSHPAPAPATP